MFFFCCFTIIMLDVEIRVVSETSAKDILPSLNEFGNLIKNQLPEGQRTRKLTYTQRPARGCLDDWQPDTEGEKKKINCHKLISFFLDSQF